MPLSIRALSVLAFAGALFAVLFTKVSAEPPEARARQYFQDAASGKFPEGSTGDPIADDIIDVMKQSKPIADRLSLDPYLDGTEATSLAEDEKRSLTRKAVAAEQMLRAARLLESVGESEPDRVTLVQRMRSEARRLLSE